MNPPSSSSSTAPPPSSSSNPQSSSSSFGPSSSSNSHSQSDPTSGTSHSNPITNSSSSNPTSHSSGTQSIASTRPMDSDYQEEILENQQAVGWGSVHPVNTNKYHAFNLCGESDITFGRLPKLDYVFEKDRHLLSEQEYLNISKKHFVIKRIGDLSVELTDLSSNGTFVNGQLVGKGRKYPLTHLAIISMGLPDMEVFTFINNREKSLEDEKMPTGFKDKYSLENIILGEGVSGCVKKCFLKTQPEEKYAVKILKKGRSYSTVKDFSYESNILSSVSHPNIVEIKDCFENDYCVYMVMEYVAGGELFEFIKNKGAVNEEKGREFFQQLLEGVTYLHQQGITHRDLKPENILLDDKVDPSVLKITDFGLSRFVSETSLMETMVGTPSYLAPEILDPRVQGYTKKVDSWSLGCILFIILGGYPPFSQIDPEDMELQKAILTGSYTFHEERWESITECAKNLVRSLLTVNVDDRISVKDALKHPFVTRKVEEGEEKVSSEISDEVAPPAKKPKTSN